jgi:hypothetical protein
MMAARGLAFCKLKQADCNPNKTGFFRRFQRKPILHKRLWLMIRLAWALLSLLTAPSRKPCAKR